MAMAERFLAAEFNTPEKALIDHYTYAIVSDGDLMEGISAEAASLAGHQKLSKLIYLYDDNSISIEGSTDLAFTEDVCARFAAYGWHVQTVADGNDVDAIEAAVKAAQAETGKPSLIASRPNRITAARADSAKAHGDRSVMMTSPPPRRSSAGRRAAFPRSGRAPRSTSRGRRRVLSHERWDRC